MASSDSLCLKTSSATHLCTANSDVIENPCSSSTFLCPPKRKDTLIRLNSTSSHSSASDYSIGVVTPRITSQEFLLYGPKRLQRTTSLEEIYHKKPRKREHNQRRKSEFCLRESDIKRRSSKKLNRKRSSKASRGCYDAFDIERGSLEVGPSHRTRKPSESNSIKTANNPRRQIPLLKEEAIGHRRKRKILKIILGVYVVLFCISILCVVVTLTHTTTATVADKNSTKNLTYYTFSPNPDVPIYEENR